MRNLTAEDWPTKGQTKDSGAGSRAKVLAAGLSTDEQTLVSDALSGVVESVKHLPEPVQRCLGFMLAADYSPQAILDKANESPAPATKKIAEEAWDRVAEEFDGSGTPQEWGEALVKYTAIVSAERTAVRKAKEIAKGTPAS